MPVKPPQAPVQAPATQTVGKPALGKLALGKPEASVSAEGGGWTGADNGGALSPQGEREERAFARRLLEAEANAVRSLTALVGGGDSVGAGGAFGEAVTLIVRCAEIGGTVLVTGLGKSGLVGAKIAATLASLGIPAHFVHPSEAAHGDLGRFRPTDLCIALSYSGETDEVVELAASLRQDGIPVISITRGGGAAMSSEAQGVVGEGAANSLDRMSSVQLPIGACDDAALTPAPTSSTTASMALGDALAVCAARRRNFSDAEFARRHPGGALGGLMRPLVEILRFTVGRNIRPAFDDLSVRDALAVAELPGVRRPGALLLVDRVSGRMTGIFTDADVRRLVQRDVRELDRPIREMMTRSPSTLPSSALVRDAVRLVQTSRRDEIPVVDEQGCPVGVLDVQDLIAMKVIQSAGTARGGDRTDAR